MSKLIQAGATQLDADVCNNIDPPVIGCHAGAGLHVTIPGDWQARILAGQQVPGCSYHTLQPEVGTATIDALVVTSAAVTQVAIPAVVNALSAPLKAQAALLQTKLASAIVLLTGQAHADSLDTPEV